MATFKNPLKYRTFNVSTTVLIVLVLLVVIGFWLRIHNLGSLGLIGDEGHQALSVNGILNHGFPLNPSGGVYTRSILFSYTQSFSALIFGVNEFSLRLPAVLFNLVCIVAIFFYGRLVFNSKVGLLSAFILTFSVWEIELSRYGRMYTAFQLLYLYSLFVFYKGFITGEKIYRLLVIPFFVLTYTIHSIGVLLLTAFFVPFFIKPYNIVRKRTLILYMGSISASVYIYGKTITFILPPSELGPLIQSFSTNANTPNNTFNIVLLAKRFIQSHFNYLYMPWIGLQKQLYNDHLWLLLLISGALLLILGYLAYRFVANQNERGQIILSALIIISCFLYQTTLALFFLYFYVLLFYTDLKSLKTKSLISIYLSAVFFFLFWFVYSIFAETTYPYSFWDYPKVYQYFFQWFVEGWPLFTFTIGAALIVMTYLYLKDKKAVNHLFSILVFLLPLFITSFINRPFYESRYLFHLYPLFIVVFSFCTVSAVKHILLSLQSFSNEWKKPIRYMNIIEATVLVFVAAILTQDISPSEVIAISRRSYVTTKSPIKGSFNWKPYADFHQDYKSAARFVKNNMKVKDLIIVMGVSHVAPIYYHYIGQVDYIILKKPFGYLTYTNGEKSVMHYVTGSIEITDSNTFQQILKQNHGHRVWLLTDYFVADQYYPEDIQKTLEKLEPQKMFTARDGKTYVYLGHAT